MTPENWRQFCDDYDVAVAVLSRDRAEVLSRRTDLLVSGYTLFWSGPGYDQRPYHSAEMVEVPRNVEGRPSVANWALRHLKQNVVVLLDDDLRFVYWLGEATMGSCKLDQSGVRAMLTNLVVNAIDVKAGLFGISENDVRKNSPLSPFHTRAMVTALVGIVGRGLWYDERQKLKADYDFCLQALKRDRLIWKDQRYFLAQDRNNFAGGSMRYRSREREEAEVENLRRWWGEDVINWKEVMTTKSLRINVPQGGRSR